MVVVVRLLCLLGVVFVDVLREEEKDGRGGGRKRNRGNAGRREKLRYTVVLP